MGSRYLTDLADVCRRTGYPVIEVGSGPGRTGPEWKQRARGSGGFNSGLPNHVMVHHTASGPSADGWGDANYCTFSASSKPLCNLYLSRKGEIFVCAGGATNTNGSGFDPCDPAVTADDSMNSSAVGIEAGNGGTGEPWPAVQQEAYLALVSELCAAYGIPTGRAHGHLEWAPQRKIDPAGPSRWAGSGSWNMDGFRGDLSGASGSPAPVPPTPVSPPVEEDDVKLYVVLDPGDGQTQYVTDMATFKTSIPSPGVADEGVDLFGWCAWSDTQGFYPLGAGWGPFLDQLPTTSP